MGPSTIKAPFCVALKAALVALILMAVCQSGASAASARQQLAPPSPGAFGSLSRPREQANPAWEAPAAQPQPPQPRTTGFAEDESVGVVAGSSPPGAPASTPAYIPGYGWVTIVWAQPPPPPPLEPLDPLTPLPAAAGGWPMMTEQKQTVPPLAGARAGASPPPAPTAPPPTQSARPPKAVQGPPAAPPAPAPAATSPLSAKGGSSNPQPTQPAKNTTTATAGAGARPVIAAGPSSPAPSTSVGLLAGGSPPQPAGKAVQQGGSNTTSRTDRLGSNAVVPPAGTTTNRNTTTAAAAVLTAGAGAAKGKPGAAAGGAAGSPAPAPPQPKVVSGTHKPLVSKTTSSRAAAGVAPGASNVSNASSATSVLPWVFQQPPGHITSALSGPQPYVFKQPGARQTIKIGCLLEMPQEGQRPEDAFSSANFEAMKLALQDKLPPLKLPINVNLTCLYLNCFDIAAHHAMLELVERGAEAVIAAVCSTDAVVASGIAVAAQVPIISPRATSPQLSGQPYFSRTVPSDRYQGFVAAQLARKLGMSNVAMVVGNAAYGQGLAFSFEAAFSALGGISHRVYEFKPYEGDPQAAVAALLPVAPDISNSDGLVVFVNNVTFMAELLREVHMAPGLSQLPVLMGDSAATTDLSALVKDDPSVLKHLTFTMVAKGSKGCQANRTAGSPHAPKVGLAGPSYDAMTAVLGAYAAARPPKSPPDVAQQLPKQRFKGVTGPVVFDSQGDLIPHNCTYARATFNVSTGKIKVGAALPLPQSLFDAHD